jgi:hypothetical protein
MNIDHKNENSERKFLHDFATPLATALLLMDLILEDVQNRSSSDPDDLMRLKEIYQALENLNNMLQGRRTILIAQEVPSAKS